jgi:diaminopimelate decarboxylase
MMGTAQVLRQWPQVDLTTFDTVCELAKLARWHPGTKALLRIRADDPAARCQLGNKYGAEPELAPGLLRVRHVTGGPCLPPRASCCSGCWLTPGAAI